MFAADTPPRVIHRKHLSFTAPLPPTPRDFIGRAHPNVVAALNRVRAELAAVGLRPS